MYFVDRETIEETLQYMEKQLAFFEQQPAWDSAVEQLALERVAHVVIESVLDVGNAMIDGFIMRDPGSYEDIIDILDDERVVSKDMVDPLKTVVAHRKIIVQQYVKGNPVETAAILADVLPVLKAFPAKVRTYLENELGPVSAFRR